MWVATTGRSIQIPAGLPKPASLPAGSFISPNTYYWTPINSVDVRAGGDSDTMLDGRQIKKFHFDFGAAYNPSVIRAGSFNFLFTEFTVP